MTREEALKRIKMILEEATANEEAVSYVTSDDADALDIAIKALEQAPCREADDYENEISDLHNHLDIVEYDKERLREEVTTLEEKLKGLSAEPCKDAISRQAVIDVIERWLECSGYNEAERHIMRAVQSVLYDSPSVNPQKSKTGYWIYEDALYSRCSECGELAIISNWAKVLSDFCPCCGAKMVEPQESEVNNG